MPPVETTYGHIAFNEEGAPVILQPGVPAGAAMKVVELVAEKVAYGWSPEELHFQHPYLSLGQIYSALAYFYDHEEALEADIARRLAQVDEQRIEQERNLGLSPLMKRLRQKGVR